MIDTLIVDCVDTNFFRYLILFYSFFFAYVYVPIFVDWHTSVLYLFREKVKY